MSQQTDTSSQELFFLIGQGDERAFERLYDRYWKALFNQACKRLNDPEKSRDIVQNVFMDIWNRRAVLAVENPEAYLRTAIRFQVIKETAKHAGHFADVFENEISSCFLADDLLADHEMQNLLRLFLEALPAKRRRIFELHYFEAHSTTAIAEQLCLNRKTVQNQLHSAARLLRLRLQQFLIICTFLGSLLR
ncbi:sigma-70 family RNA polymerase sigma factor [Pedobacter sp. SYP-B3415]|uniref:sigma-70 family RNA polymerase sigma factor n=1 Tax=Pedobacter sp. SYP-B3415 TaxID=2496641 RepID=UPI0013EBF30F|nr:sigma-70 family RNA polymerase sigma factor [Pedobacter sp. SYP-B3415]